MSIVRNPYTRFLSRYKFGWWKEHCPIGEEKLRERFPSFPDLTIDEFAADQMRVNHVYGFGEDPHVGSDTVRFIKMFFRSPENYLSGLTDEKIDSVAVFDHMQDVTLLQQESLRQELTAFLRRHGYSDEELSSVRNKRRVNVSQSSADPSSTWTEAALKHVQRYERLVFRILEERDISYEAPRL